MQLGGKPDGPAATRRIVLRVASGLLALIGVLTPAPSAGASSGQAACRDWRVVKSPQSPEVELQAVSASSSTDVWATGYNKGGVNPPPLMHWNGRGWGVYTPMPGGFLSGVEAIAPDDAWAVGPAIFDRGLPAFHWDGVRWRDTHAPLPTSASWFFDVSAVTPDDVWAVGYYVDSQIRPLTEHWDGTGWTVVPAPQTSGNNQLYQVAALGTDDVWAVGIEDRSVGDFHPLIEHWDGSAWTVAEVPEFPGNSDYLFGVDGSSSTDAWAVGVQEGGNPLVLHWDGTAWTEVSVPVPPEGGKLTGVSVLSPTDAWAAGIDFTGQGEATDLPLTMHWDGSEWTIVPAKDPEGRTAFFADVVATSATDIWAVGTVRGSKGQVLVERSRGVCPD